MDSYTEYLERLVELKEQEIRAYKGFIEQQLGRKIQSEVMIGRALNEEYKSIKIITIPETRIAIHVDDKIMQFGSAEWYDTIQRDKML